jgi:hypothetical protein
VTIAAPIIAAPIIQTSINWWDLVPAILGGVIGALAGGIPAYYLSKSATQEALRRDQLSRDANDRLSGLQLYLALSRTGNDVFSARQQIDEMLARPVSEGDKFPTQRQLSVFSGGNSSTINPFAELDLSPFAAANGIELINQLDLLGRCYVTQIVIISDYRTHKERLFELYELSAEADAKDAETLVFKLDRAQHGAKLAIREQTAESIAQGVVEAIMRNCTLFYDASKSYNAAVTGFLSHLNLPQIDLSLVLQRFPELEG